MRTPDLTWKEGKRIMCVIVIWLLPVSISLFSRGGRSGRVRGSSRFSSSSSSPLSSREGQPEEDSKGSSPGGGSGGPISVGENEVTLQYFSFNSLVNAASQTKKGNWKVQDKRIWKLIQSVDIASKPYYIASCVRITNEESFMYEWLVHCLLNGINHVYVYDNSLPGFDAREALQPFVEVGYVSYFNRSAEVMLSHPFHLNKAKMYNRPEQMRHVWLTDECLQTFRHEMKWLVTTDVDEFWVSPPEWPLPKFLRTAENDTNALSVSWHLMKPMGFWSVASAKYRTQANWVHCSRMGMTGVVNCNHNKLIVKADAAIQFHITDEPAMKPGPRRIQIRCDNPFLGYLHYHTKTFEEMLSKRHRGWAYILPKGQHPSRSEVVTHENGYCPGNVSATNPKIAAFAEKLQYYLVDLPWIPFRRLKPSCPPKAPYPPGQQPPDEHIWLYFENKFDQCFRFSEAKYEQLASTVANRPRLTWPLLYDFVLHADFSGNLTRYDVFFEPWPDCTSAYECPTR